MFIHLHVIYACSHTIRAELRSCNRDHMAHKARVFAIWPFTGKRLTLAQVPYRLSSSHINKMKAPQSASQHP